MSSAVHGASSEAGWGDGDWGDDSDLFASDAATSPPVTFDTPVILAAVHAVQPIQNNKLDSARQTVQKPSLQHNGPSSMNLSDNKQPVANGNGVHVEHAVSAQTMPRTLSFQNASSFSFDDGWGEDEFDQPFSTAPLAPVPVSHSKAQANPSSTRPVTTIEPAKQHVTPAQITEARQQNGASQLPPRVAPVAKEATHPPAKPTSATAAAIMAPVSTSATTAVPSGSKNTQNLVAATKTPLKPTLPSAASTGTMATTPKNPAIAPKTPAGVTAAHRPSSSIKLPSMPSLTPQSKSSGTPSAATPTLAASANPTVANKRLTQDGKPIPLSRTSRPIITDSPAGSSSATAPTSSTGPSVSETRRDVIQTVKPNVQPVVTSVPKPLSASTDLFGSLDGSSSSDFDSLLESKATPSPTLPIESTTKTAAAPSTMDHAPTAANALPTVVKQDPIVTKHEPIPPVSESTKSAPSTAGWDDDWGEDSEDVPVSTAKPALPPPATQAQVTSTASVAISSTEPKSNAEQTHTGATTEKDKKSSNAVDLDWGDDDADSLPLSTTHTQIPAKVTTAAPSLDKLKPALSKETVPSHQTPHKSTISFTAPTLSLEPKPSANPTAHLPPTHHATPKASEAKKPILTAFTPSILPQPSPQVTHPTPTAVASQPPPVTQPRSARPKVAAPPKTAQTQFATPFNVSAPSVAPVSRSKGPTHPGPLKLEDMRRPHALVSFAFGGTLVAVFPGTSFAGSSAVQPGPVSLIPTSKSLANHHDTMAMKAFPGPALARSSKELNNFLTARCKHADQATLHPNPVRGEAARFLWHLLRLLMNSKGVVNGAKGCEKDIQALLAAVSSHPDAIGRAPSPSLATEMSEVAISSEKRAEHITAIQSLVQVGKRDEALQLAMNEKIWDHALVLAAFISPSVHRDTVSAYVVSTLPVGSPLRATYLQLAGKSGDLTRLSASPAMPVVPLFGGAHPQNPTPNPSVNQYAGLTEHWKANINAILANRPPQLSAAPPKGAPAPQPQPDQALIHLGDALWAHTGSVEAAHLCYILADYKMDNRIDSGSRFILVGGDHKRQPRTATFNIEALHKSELLEYAKRQGTSGFSYPGLQVYKLLYAFGLVDLGLFKLALEYLDSIKLIVSESAKQAPALYSPVFLRQVNELYARIKATQDAKAGKAITSLSSDSVPSTSAQDSGWFGSFLKTAVANAVEKIIGEEEIQPGAPQPGQPKVPLSTSGSQLPPAQLKTSGPLPNGLPKAPLGFMPIASTGPQMPPLGQGKEGIPAGARPMPSGGPSGPVAPMSAPLSASGTLHAPPSNQSAVVVGPPGTTAAAPLANLHLPSIRAPPKATPKHAKPNNAVSTPSLTPNPSSTQLNTQPAVAETKPPSAKPTAAPAPDAEDDEAELFSDWGIPSLDTKKDTPATANTAKIESEKVTKSAQDLEDEAELFNGSFGEDSKQEQPKTAEPAQPEPKNEPTSTPEANPTDSAPAASEEVSAPTIVDNTAPTASISPFMGLPPKRTGNAPPKKPKLNAGFKPSVSIAPKAPSPEAVPSKPEAVAVSVTQTPSKPESRSDEHQEVENPVETEIEPVEAPSSSDLPHTEPERTKPHQDPTPPPKSEPSPVDHEETPAEDESVTPPVAEPQTPSKYSQPPPAATPTLTKRPSLLPPRKTPAGKPAKNGTGATSQGSEAPASSVPATPVAVKPFGLNAPEGLPPLSEVESKPLKTPAVQGAVPPSSSQTKRTERMNKRISAPALPRTDPMMAPKNAEDEAQSDDEKTQEKVLEDARQHIAKEDEAKKAASQAVRPPIIAPTTALPPISTTGPPKGSKPKEPAAAGSRMPRPKPQPMAAAPSPFPTFTPPVVSASAPPASTKKEAESSSSSDSSDSSSEDEMKTPQAKPKAAGARKPQEAPATAEQPKRGRLWILNPRNWFGSRTPQPAQQGKPVEVKLGGSLKDGPFYRHPELGWVERGKEEEKRREMAAAAAPPAKSDKKRKPKPEQEPEGDSAGRGPFTRTESASTVPSTPLSASSSSSSLKSSSTRPNRNRRYVGASGDVIDNARSGEIPNTLLPPLTPSTSATSVSVFTPMAPPPGSIDDAPSAPSEPVERVATVKQPKKQPPKTKTPKKKGEDASDEEKEDLINSQPLTLSASFPIPSEDDDDAAPVVPKTRAERKAEAAAATPPQEPPQTDTPTRKFGAAPFSAGFRPSSSSGSIAAPPSAGKAASRKSMPPPAASSPEPVESASSTASTIADEPKDDIAEPTPATPATPFNGIPTFGLPPAGRAKSAVRAARPKSRVLPPGSMPTTAK